MITFETTLHTAGDGWWSDASRAVEVKRLNVAYINNEADFGELRVYFDTATWDVDDLGLIYTDNLFLEELRDVLNAAGFAGHDVEYSEQGMQGRNYVSLDVGEEFLDSWSKVVDKLAA